MGNYKKMWILLQEKVANRAIEPKKTESARYIYEHTAYANIAAVMAELQADVLLDNLRECDE